MVHEHRAGGGREGADVRARRSLRFFGAPLLERFLEISRRESNAASQLEVVPGMPVAVRKA